MGAATYRAYQAVGRGRLELVDRPVEEPATGMVRVAVGEHSIAGQNTGTPIEIEDALNFSLLQNIRASIQKVPFERAPDGYARMLANAARFRMVIEMTPST